VYPHTPSKSVRAMALHPKELGFTHDFTFHIINNVEDLLNIKKCLDLCSNTMPLL
jgi:hypothetical protein